MCAVPTCSGRATGATVCVVDYDVDAVPEDEVSVERVVGVERSKASVKVVVAVVAVVDVVDVVDAGVVDVVACAV